MATIGPDITRAALIIVDMQNDFLHPDGEFSKRARAFPERKIDMAFLNSITPSVKRLVQAFRKAGRPVVHIIHVLKPDYSDAAFPYWRRPPVIGKEFIFEGTWGAKIIDELTPLPIENVVIKKGYDGFANTPMVALLRNLDVNTCVVTGIAAGVCVTSTVRGGVEYNYRMIVVSDAIADLQKELHETALSMLTRGFAEARTTKEIIEMLRDIK